MSSWNRSCLQPRLSCSILSTFPVILPRISQARTSSIGKCTALTLWRLPSWRSARRASTSASSVLSVEEGSLRRAFSRRAGVSSAPPAAWSLARLAPWYFVRLFLFGRSSIALQIILSRATSVGLCRGSQVPHFVPSLPVPIPNATEKSRFFC